jgi:hypothetical protein
VSLLQALGRPQVLVAFLLLFGAAVLLLAPTTTGDRPEGEFLLPEITPPETVAADVQLVTYDRFNLEVLTRRQLVVPLAPAQQLSAVLAELQAELRQAGIWPDGLPAPGVFVETLNRQRVAVLDFRPAGLPALPVAQELRLLQSIEATVLANGSNRVQFLLNGRPAGVFLWNVVVPDGL